ncbi:type IV toxin-antitoxin system AbiEi family antitoxin domain-containing protein [Nocardioides panaciterrulae]|uniref:Type IV toxin-antitoxin system AbiEi family antitoxin domain-containing protein n=1 Tax=Nocardioides panaciterrulae TaxID=661492 RepID=A0A7Y9E807_9ACTN|nr:type IV toxin-antitoxin system AbiEi family antitoxin domain-containing protein [Nocardioides panaciterrulae]NYD42885.1 hypothetical protein [Nocardioides panaciterrulae]
MDLTELLGDQAGVISRRQVLAAGLRQHDIERMLRRREWARVHEGVYVTHTGDTTWHQRAWAAVLFSWPAALSHRSALSAAGASGNSPQDDCLIDVAVDRGRHRVAPAGVRLHRMSDFHARVQWNLGPPRIRYEHAVLDLAAEARSDSAAVAVLSDACGARRTTTARLSAALADRPRLPRRAWLADVLADVAAGTCSVLEHGYLTLVERPHGLPEGRRQASHRHGDKRVYQDVEYVDLGTYVEFDGRLFHSSAAARDLDMGRDLESAASDGSETLRISYGMVFDRPCTTAASVGAVLQRHGWTGSPTTCPRCA